MDKGRGGSLELLLTKIKLSFGSKQVIALSAVLDQLNGFDNWLGLDVVSDKKRPVEIRQGVVGPKGIYNYREWNSRQAGTEQFPGNSLLSIVSHLLSQNEQLIIIRNSVRATVETAIELSDNFTELKAASSTIKLLSNAPDTETRDGLLKTLRQSIAFHHADCELNERRAVEEGFRNGEIRIIVATTTLSMGVNLPSKTVILADNSKWVSVKGKLQLVNWSVSEVRNILGRAGRLGSTVEQNQNFGRGILIANNQHEVIQLQTAYLYAPLEPLKSSLENKDITLRVLDVVATGFAGTELDIISFMFNTFAARNWDNPESKRQIEELIHRGIATCLEYGLFERDSLNNIVATNLGKVCAAKQITIRTFSILKQFVDRIETEEQISENIFDMLYTVSNAEEVRDANYRGVYWDRKERNALAVLKVRELLSTGELPEEYSRRLTGISYLTEEQTKCFTIAILAKELLLTNILSKVNRKNFMLINANVRDICLNLRWILDALTGIAGILKPQISSYIEMVSNCISHRVPLSCRFLNSIRVELCRDEKIKLVEAGYTSEDDFLDKTGSDFRGIINPSRADEIIEEVLTKRKRNFEFWEKDHKRRLSKIGTDLSNIIKLYQSTGLELETVIEELFETGFSNCTVTRIHDQRKGEPDLLMMFPNGQKITIQVTAKENFKNFVDSKKAGDVIPQSARFHPDGFMCLGRPDFQDLAIEQAFHQSKDNNFKLIPMYLLAELYVRSLERRLTPDVVAEFLLNAKGYLSVNDIDIQLGKALQ
ncbi:hypothetical protein GTO91_13370 [Heliobacterium undosum]|uniref:Helicase C-terminal domain-containing protein n=2 Tax=Heliomicrobium undosum TaxID=121734 RepID=A0A845L369_9FIRM|nr:hypothetical protein [Heliomicrobium undosum]